MPFSRQDKYVITVLPGDGIGPEICNEAVKVLKEIAKIYEHNFVFENGLCGGEAYTKYKNHLPEPTLELLGKSEAVLFGTIGGPVDSQEDPKWKDVQKNCRLGLRKKLKIAINMRVAKIYPSLMDVSPLKDRIVNKGVDIFLIRELVSATSFGEFTINGETDIDLTKASNDNVSITLIYGFMIAKERKQKLCIVDTSNLLECSPLWRMKGESMAKDRPYIELTFMSVEDAANQIIQNPSQFDVILTRNMFGDTLSHAISALPGSLGLVTLSGVGDGVSLFEQAGGPAHDIAGKGIANPIGQILSAAMLLRYGFNLNEEAVCVEEAVEEALKKGLKTADLIVPSPKKKKEKPLKTNEMGDAIISIIQKKNMNKRQKT